MIYYLAVCKCGEIQSNQTRKPLLEATMNCRKCKRGIKVKGKEGLNIRILKSSTDPRFIAQLNGAVKEDIYINRLSSELDELRMKDEQIWGLKYGKGAA